METFAQRFNEVLKEKKLRQIDVANKTGIAPGTISNYAQGKYEPKGLNLEKIAFELDINDAWLAGYDAPKERNHSTSIEFGRKLSPGEEEYYSQDLPIYEREEEVTRMELDIITAYRDADPAIQAAVRKLLDVEASA